jgi:glycosyltransferase involved in cell wall biosynthesis
MLVSCIMPTRNRRRFVGQAIWYFLRQDYEPRELLILDDGDDPVEDLVPSDPRISYRRLESRLPLGAKRNLACELSRGELIAHWDDDDWIAPHRLSLQVRELIGSGADACGASELLYYAPMSGEAWRYRHPASERPWLAGATLLYRKALWREHRFPDVNVGEDSAFVRQLPPECLHAVTDPSFYVAVLHGGNTAAKNLRDPRWDRRPLDEASRLLALDRDFYVTVRNRHPIHERNPRLRPAGSVTVAAPFMVYDGYGSMAEYLVLGLARAGATVNVVPLGLEPEGLSGELREIIRRSRPEPGAPLLYDSWPQASMHRFQASPDLFIHTMWEGSRLPAGWTAQLNRMRAVLVPTRFVARVCRDSGVQVPTEVVPDGVDPATYHYEHRPERAGVTTLIVATVVPRKHTLEGIAAWKLAFAGDPDARLIVKARFGYGNHQPDDPRITLVDRNETTRGIAHWYREADVLLALGNEGFGLPLVEGMATGLPVVALSSEGQADVCEDAGDLLLPIHPARWQPCDDPPFGPGGVRGVPAVEDVAERLRWVAGHRDEARDLGRAASAWVLRHRDVWGKGPAVIEVMERYARPRRPLRRTRTLWASARVSPCGVADYTASLAGAVADRVRVARQRPDIAGLRLLHVQHADGLFDEAELTRCAQQVRHVGVPVCITEHAVATRASAWEREADALVALTPPGAERLRARWPHKPVHYLPHGCPTWFPPRKQARGRVIGAFGFLARHKGFWRLPEVLRAVSGTEALLISYSSSAEGEASWAAATGGLPARRVSELLPVEEVARRLAAEADLLVFWYDEVPRAAASGAVRVGLASGVPVLTSPTTWFSDLTDVTYQPDDLVEGVRRLLEDTQLRDRLTTAARDYCQEHSWPRTARRHLELWEALEAA